MAAVTVRGVEPFIGLGEHVVWDVIRPLIDTGDGDGLVERLIGLEPGERAPVAAGLREHLPTLARRDFDEAWASWPEPARLAGAGTISSVGGVAAWVNRRDLLTPDLGGGRASYGDPGPMVRVLACRDPAWQADLAVRLAARVRGPRDPGAPLALAMLRHTGVEPPANDALVVAWVSGAGAADDPLWPVLMPRLFEAEGVGRVLRSPGTGWLRVLSSWAGRDPASRAQVLDGCVRRFLRGGSALDLRFFVRLHELLAPSSAEVDARRRDYLRLLPVGPAAVALDRLRRLGGWEFEDVAEAVEGLVFRAEVKLARAGLGWLDDALREWPGRADELAGALVMGFGHEAYEVQGRAAQLALKHRALFGAEGRERIREGLPALPAALGARLRGITAVAG